MLDERQMTTPFHDPSIILDDAFVPNPVNWGTPGEAEAATLSDIVTFIKL